MYHDVIEKERYTSLEMTYGAYQEAAYLKNRLMEEYNGVSLSEAIDGEIIETENGGCYHIESHDFIDFKMISFDHARQRIISNLKLIFGIGESKEMTLKQSGYRTIEDLAEHPRFGPDAFVMLQIIRNGDLYPLMNRIEHWFPKSHALILYASSLQNKEDYVILDIETMGMAARPIILIGVAVVSRKKITVHQYLVRDIREEPAALLCFLSHVNQNSIFMTFNGRMFDMPYIRDRLRYYGIPADLQRSHIDVLPFSRRAWKDDMPDCRLTTLEKHLLGVERQEDVPSALVPEFYRTYLRTRNVGPLIPVVKHNRQDILTLALIYLRLHEMLAREEYAC